jgi:two-component system NtrC family sensor kinase
VDERGAVVASAGRFYRSIPTGALWVESQEETASAMRMVVVLPRGGALVGEVSLTQSPGERTLVAAMLLYTLLASSAGLFVLYALLTRYTVRPLEALTRVAERVAAGSREARAEPRGAREIARAATAFNGMTEELAQRESELRKRVVELERAQGELRAAQARLVRSERLAVVGRLSAGIAHEVGNPLAAIVGLADLLAEGGLDESEVRDFSGRIGQEAQRIHRTVRDLLDYARARPGAEGDEVGAREEVADGRGDVGDAVEQVRRLLEPQRTMKELKMTVELGPELPAVKLSNDRLVQVLLNLCLNAADAIRDARGDGAVGAITLRASRHGGGVAIEVEDDGPGIAPAIRDRVFEPFFTTKPAGQGTGLGLAICASVVEQAGGAVSALGRQDGAPGARVRVELPAA